MLIRSLGSALLLALCLGGITLLAQPPVEPGGRYSEPTNVIPVSLAGRSLPAMPPTPVVQIMVLVPQDAVPRQDIPYQIKVVNSSSARAYKVRVRMPWPEGAASVNKVEPVTLAPPLPDKDLHWEFNTIEGNESRTISLSFKPKDNAAEVTARAYVSFEHGQKVTTRLSEPKLKIKVDAPKQTAREDWIPIRVTMQNPGRVPAAAVRLTMNISEGFEFNKDDGGEPTKEKANQRVWEVGTMAPNMMRPVTIRVRGKEGRKLQVLAAINSSNMAADKDEATVEVLDAKLEVTLRGDPKVAANDMAHYEMVVKNTGTMPLTNVRAMGSVPEDCSVTNRTKDGQLTTDRVEWTIPKLAPGEATSKRWKLASKTTGRRTIRAAAVAVGSKGIEEVSSVETYFQGAPNLSWEQRFDRTVVSVDQNAMLTIKVSNTGSEPATNVRLKIDLPKEVSLVEATPTYKKSGDRLTFDIRTVAPGKTETYSLTFKGEKEGKAYFDAVLDSDALAGKPLPMAKYVDIVARQTRP